MDSELEKINKFEQKFNLPSKFFLNLIKESDWGFIIKLHSLFESAATYILNIMIGEDRIKDSISYLDFSNSQYGKVKLLYELDALTSDQISFLRLLSELRNEVVHKIENVTFSFDSYLKKSNKNKVKSFCNRIGYNCHDQIVFKDKPYKRDQFICDNAKVSIWLTAMDVLACILIEEELVEIAMKRRQSELDFIQTAVNITKLLDQLSTD